MRNRPRVRWGALARRGFVAAAALIAFACAHDTAFAKTRHRGGAPARHYSAAQKAAWASPTDPSKDAALILEADTGKVLYERNAYASRHPASLTKMMTLYLLFDALKKGTLTLDSNLAISAHAAAQKPTNLHLWAGDSIPVETAIKAIVVRSANDVAVAIAEGIGGTESHFAQLMTQTARNMGMNNTFYDNASGLPDPLQVTTASDLSILARRLRTDFPQYYPYFSTPAFYYRGVNYVTHDNLIGRYDGTDGIKTGYTGMSGFNLVSSVNRGGRRIIGVVMGGRTAHKRDNEMMALLDNAYGVKSYAPPTTVLASTDATAPQPAVPQQSPQQKPASIPLFSLANLFPKPKPPLPKNTTLRPSASDDDEDAAERRVAVDDPILPKPKPIVVAAYKPPKPKQVAHIDLGEGDIGDMPKSTAALAGGQKWTIQIGAYADAAAARAQLASYAERSMDVLGQATRLVMPFQSVDGHKLYRARFGPFAEKEARAVCATLSKRGQTCFAASTN